MPIQEIVLNSQRVKYIIYILSHVDWASINERSLFAVANLISPVQFSSSWYFNEEYKIKKVFSNIKGSNKTTVLVFCTTYGGNLMLYSAPYISFFFPNQFLLDWFGTYFSAWLSEKLQSATGTRFFSFFLMRKYITDPRVFNWIFRINFVLKIKLLNYPNNFRIHF